jgi:hypothetical protein
MQMQENEDQLKKGMSNEDLLPSGAQSFVRGRHHAYSSSYAGQAGRGNQRGEARVRGSDAWDGDGVEQVLQPDGSCSLCGRATWFSLLQYLILGAKQRR